MLSVMSMTSAVSAQTPPFEALSLHGVNTNANNGDIDYVEVFANNVTNNSNFFKLSIYPNSSAKDLKYRYTIGSTTTAWIDSPNANQSVELLLWLRPRQGVVVDLEVVRNSCARTVGDFVATLDRGVDNVVNDIVFTPSCV